MLGRRGPTPEPFSFRTETKGWVWVWVWGVIGVPRWHWGVADRRRPTRRRERRGEARGAAACARDGDCARARRHAYVYMSQVLLAYTYVNVIRIRGPSKRPCACDHIILHGFTAGLSDCPAHSWQRAAGEAPPRRSVRYPPTAQQSGSPPRAESSGKRQWVLHNNIVQAPHHTQDIQFKNELRARK